MKIWIVVYNYGLCNVDVYAFNSFEKAKQAFKDYTGFEYDPEGKYGDSFNQEYSEYHGQSDIFNKRILTNVFNLVFLAIFCIIHRKI